jgi:hypothetical protein
MGALADWVKSVKTAGDSGISPSGGGPGGGVTNPGERNWGLISSNRPLQSSSHSAGAIRRGKKYDDYEGWAPRDFTIPYHDKDHDIHLTFQISVQVRGYPKGGATDQLHVKELRVWGESTGSGGSVDAEVEDAHAIWETWAAVKFNLVIRIDASDLHGGKRTVRRSIIVQGDGTGEIGNPIVTPGI